MANRFLIISAFFGIAGLLAFVALNIYYKKPPDLVEASVVFVACGGIIAALDCGRLLLVQLWGRKKGLGVLQNHWFILVLGVLASIWIAIDTLIKLVLAVIAYTPP